VVKKNLFKESDGAVPMCSNYDLCGRRKLRTFSV